MRSNYREIMEYCNAEYSGEAIETDSADSLPWPDPRCCGRFNITITIEYSIDANDFICLRHEPRDFHCKLRQLSFNFSPSSPRTPTQTHSPTQKCSRQVQRSNDHPSHRNQRNPLKTRPRPNESSAHITTTTSSRAPLSQCSRNPRLPTMRR